MIDFEGLVDMAYQRNIAFCDRLGLPAKGWPSRLRRTLDMRLAPTPNHPAESHHLFLHNCIWSKLEQPRRVPADLPPEGPSFIDCKIGLPLGGNWQSDPDRHVIGKIMRVPIKSRITAGRLTRTCITESLDEIEHAVIILVQTK